AKGKQMGDVADILGGARRPQVSERESLLMETGPKAGGTGGAGGNKGKRKPAGMSREVFNLIGKEGMAPVVVSKKAIGLKDKREGTARTRWIWTTFKNSARKDQDKPEGGEEEGKEGENSGTRKGGIFYHWVKAATDYPDYPFARFNVQTPAVEFTDAEYKTCLAEGGKGAGWSKEETRVLLELCQRFDLRWPIIYDRFPDAVAESVAGSPGGPREPAQKEVEGQEGKEEGKEEGEKEGKE
ncbi:dna methyltransferase 1-associated protein 1, partial [Nannochloropsis gaditana CCMP526]|uniref:dna methyltransferase 1-associated protein 1 n=1 Tax=Nannochloropsis gaditana (strain CCMP526) TaxID=1093141 RepID=UPI00029F6E6D